MTFTATDIMAWGTLIGVILTGAAAIISAFRLGRVEAHVNSAATAAVATNSGLQKQIEMLKDTISKMDQAAALLAQTAAARHRLEAAVVVPLPAGIAPTIAPVVEAVLKNIEINTEITAQNTAVKP